jgi:hypothetical protein
MVLDGLSFLEESWRLVVISQWVVGSGWWLVGSGILVVVACLKKLIWRFGK